MVNLGLMNGLAWFAGGCLVNEILSRFMNVIRKRKENDAYIVFQSQQDELKHYTAQIIRYREN